MYTIEIENTHTFRVDFDRVRDAIATVLRQHDKPEASGLTVNITDEATVRRLNKDYRGIDAATDVLSFPAEMPPLPDEATDAYLGDIAIAYPYVEAQAKQLGYTVTDNLLLMAVHGTLHLLRYDHDTPENRAVMWAAQAKALVALAVPLAIVPALEEFDE